MGRKPLISPTRPLHVRLDAKLMEAVDARLYSEAEQRVPYAAYADFMTEAIVRLLRQETLDLAPYANSLPTEHVIYAFPGTRELLIELLTQQERNQS